MQDHVPDQYHISNNSDVVPSTVTSQFSDNSIISGTKSSITIGMYLCSYTRPHIIAPVTT